MIKNIYKCNNEIFDTLDLMLKKYPEIHSVGHEPNIIKVQNKDTKEVEEKTIGYIYLWENQPDEMKLELKELFKKQIRAARKPSIKMYDIYINRIVVGRAEKNQEIEDWFDKIRNVTNDEVIEFVKVQEGYEGKPKEHIPEPPQILLDIIIE